jgi:gamma-glutamyltranspeptidase/glutathione hydrolase
MPGGGSEIVAPVTGPTSFGTFSRADVMEPAIRHASRGFRVTPYLHECVTDCAADLALDPEIARLYLPGGVPIPVGARLVAGDYAETLRDIVSEGQSILYTGSPGYVASSLILSPSGSIGCSRSSRATTAIRRGTATLPRRNYIGVPVPSRVKVLSPRVRLPGCRYLA